ncbi:AbrB/MazE/SpoVT family DNA-binding domain-containing protein [Pseudomonas aeruginosa]|uniref:AbrB/MazE/SpoVT family DNA-binding domain-containing protein n=1 Tax=Pseudomonas aeruginosa TaxID=287 RepID=UPI0023598DDB
MVDLNSWRVVCQDPGDGSGDAIIELPSELLDRLGWTVGDELILERGCAEFCVTGVRVTAAAGGLRS